MRGFLLYFQFLFTFCFRFRTERKKYFLSFSLIGLILIALWVWKFQEGFEVRLENTFIRIYVRKSSFIPHNLRSFSEGFSLWFMPLGIPKWIRHLFGALIIGSLCFRSLKLCKTRQKSILTYFTIIFLVYYSVVHWVFAVSYFEAERYLTPLYSLFFLSLFLWMDEEWKNLNRTPKIILSTAIIILLFYNAIRTGKNIDFWNENRKEIENKTSLSEQ